MKKKHIEIKDKVLGIIFGDATQSWERIVSLLSALFWTWLELMFIKFAFMWIFGFAGYIIGDSFAYSYEMMIDNKEFVSIFIKCFFILIVIFRVRIHYKKEIKIKK